MIEFIQFPRDFAMPNNSPFCMRVETFLKLANIPYKMTEEPNPRKFPKGKLPAIVDEGNMVCDSQFIIDYLTTKFDVQLDQGMSDQDKVLAHTMTRMLCEHFYWIMGTGRFADPAGWPAFKAAFQAAMPPVIGGLFANMVRKGLLKQLKAAGMGRHTLEEVGRLGKQDLDVLAKALGDKPYFFGNEPTSFDATAFAFIANIVYIPAETLTKKHALRLQNLLDYCERMKARCFPDIMTATLPA